MKNQFAIEARRRLHEYPELSGLEVETSKYVRECLEQFGGFQIWEKNNNVVAVYDSGKPGKTLLMRADIDGLPVKENECNLKCKKEVVSKVEGISHVCGHDFHTAILLSVAKMVAEEELLKNGKLMVCFEAGEETGCGYPDVFELIEQTGITPDGSFGIHLYAGLEVGKITVQEGPVMAGNAGFRVNIIGKGGHGSRPDQTIDPISCAAQVINNLHIINSRVVNPMEAIVISIGMIHAGSAKNIIPNECVFEGTMRFFDENEGIKAMESLQSIVKNICCAHKCECEISIINPLMPVINDGELSKLAEKAVEKVLSKEANVHIEPWMASDSMSKYLKSYKGVYALIGIHDNENGYGAEHHNDKFDAPEVCLDYGIDLAKEFIAQFY